MNDATRPLRTHETQIEIAAARDAVWKALTDADELARWFATHAEVSPGAGGLIRLAWNEDFSLRCPVRVWKPGRHLQIGWTEAHAGGVETSGGAELVVDFFLEGERGSTVLRVVHSGFPNGPGWDEQYDGSRRGWNQELTSLRVYFERHRGKPRRLAWVRVAVPDGKRAAWERLVGARGFLRTDAIDAIAAGDRFAFEAASGDVVRGTVEIVAPPTDFVAVLDEPRGALLRLAVEDSFRIPEAQLWLSTWGLSDGRAHDLERRWFACVAP